MRCAFVRQIAGQRHFDVGRASEPVKSLTRDGRGGPSYARDTRIGAVQLVCAGVMLLSGCAMTPLPPMSAVGIVASPAGLPTTAAVTPPMTLPRFLGVESVVTGFRHVVYRSRVRVGGVLPFVQPLPASAAPVAIGDPSCLQSPRPP